MAVCSEQKLGEPYYVGQDERGRYVQCFGVGDVRFSLRRGGLVDRQNLLIVASDIHGYEPAQRERCQAWVRFKFELLRRFETECVSEDRMFDVDERLADCGVLRMHTRLTQKQLATKVVGDAALIVNKANRPEIAEWMLANLPKGAYIRKRL